MRTLIRGGRLVVPGEGEPVQRDLLIDGDQIAAMGQLSSAAVRAVDRVVDAAGRLVLPGLIDAHSHLDAMVFDPQAQLACLRQGVTTVIAGQDGVSFAPGSGDYATDYFGPLNGQHPSYRGGGVAELLRSYDQASPLNVGYLLPLGTVRHEVTGMDESPATDEQLSQMRALVVEGLDEGALGVSSGLDYVPGIHASTAELTALCRPVAEVAAVYVTHMRGGYEAKSKIGTDEIAEITAGSGVRAHISHYHGEPGLLRGLIDDLAAGGARVSYDSYFYLRGFTLAAMPLLPPSLLSGERLAVAASLRDQAVRRELLEHWFPHHEQTSAIGSQWAQQMTIAHAPGRPEVEGLTIARAALRAGQPEREFVLDLLADTLLQATTVMEPKLTRSTDEMVPLFTHPAMVGGSDGIVIGSHPHPRAFGNFVRYLRELVVDRGAWSWADAAWHLAGHTAQIMGLSSQRGRLAAGQAADLVLVDPETVSDTATYEAPRSLAVGIDDVWVNGAQVLAGGQLTGVRSGRGLRRDQSSAGSSIQDFRSPSC